MHMYHQDKYFFHSRELRPPKRPLYIICCCDFGSSSYFSRRLSLWNVHHRTIDLLILTTREGGTKIFEL